MDYRDREIKSLGEYQRQTSRFEKSDGLILPDAWIVVRIDAHRSGSEWADFADHRYPFDPSFVLALTGTAKRLFCSGFRILLAYVHGDEISLLLDPTESMNQRRRARIASLIASAGSVAFLREFPRPAVFHAVVSELPTAGHVIDYFMWQRKVAHRNFFYRTLSLRLTAEGYDNKEMLEKLVTLSEQDREDLARGLGLSEEEISSYDKYGLSLWAELDKDRPKIVVCDELPNTDIGYRDFICERIQANSFAIDESLVDEIRLIPVNLKQTASAISKPESSQELKTKSPVKSTQGAPSNRNSEANITPFRISGSARRR